jgi:hypothetical protein
MLLVYFPISRRDLRKQRTDPGDKTTEIPSMTPFAQFTAFQDSGLLLSKLDAYRNYVLLTTSSFILIFYWSPLVSYLRRHQFE